MPKILSNSQAERFCRENFLAPLDALTTDEVNHYRGRLETYEVEQGGAPLEAWQYRKLHVREPWAAQLVRHPKVLDAIEDLIGPDILVFNSTFFIKEARAAQITAWHQDATYFGLQPYEHVSAWIALSEASEQAGCMRFVVGSSGFGQLHHAARKVVGSVNHGGQAIVETFDQSKVATAPLRAGQFSVHHTLAVHSSEPNQSDDRRIGIAVSCIPTHVQHVGNFKMGATLVRGVDRFHHFTLEPDPRAAAAADNVENHRAAYRRYREGYEEQIAAHREMYGD